MGSDFCLGRCWGGCSPAFYLHRIGTHDVTAQSKAGFVSIISPCASVCVSPGVGIMGAPEHKGLTGAPSK